MSLNEAKQMLKLLEEIRDSLKDLQPQINPVTDFKKKLNKKK